MGLSVSPENLCVLAPMFQTVTEFWNRIYKEVVGEHDSNNMVPNMYPFKKRIFGPTQSKVYRRTESPVTPAQKSSRRGHHSTKDLLGLPASRTINN